ncbi:GNAT family N-acetyltransferase [Nocardioides anomalus]|uniref:GNAT family N-acetyltransferase n=1 Tax=Nocardioides anomalus TaxID=2712223 RepID=A0A6G6WK30_9ACTN|nr:GNAT family N-acetyltransferase [Nocardioides anomalus]QIG45589.1 GNAT family N-acetyltransferase [Nocardioides anomalus]
MTALVRPDARLHASWAACVHEFGPETVHGAGLWHREGPVDLTRAGLEELLALWGPYADPAAALPEGSVHCDYLWITAGDEVIGFLAVRHRLNAWLLEEGGHIGYSIRPSRRRQGHASAALALGVRRAAGLGLDRVLVTCDEDNVASARTIETNGGAYEDSRNGKRRYWVATGISAAARPTADGRSAAPA